MEDCGGVAYNKVLKHHIDYDLDLASYGISDMKEKGKRGIVDKNPNQLERDFLEWARTDFLH